MHKMCTDRNHNLHVDAFRVSDFSERNAQIVLMASLPLPLLLSVNVCLSRCCSIVKHDKTDDRVFVNKQNQFICLQFN